MRNEKLEDEHVCNDDKELPKVKGLVISTKRDERIC